jgi:predicted esterase
MKTVKNRLSEVKTLVVCLVTLFFLPAISAFAQESFGRFADRVFRDDTGEHKYVVFVPNGYRPEKSSPAILFLHGAGERGKDNRLQLSEGLAPFVQARARSFPFLVVFPQCDLTDGRILESWRSDNPGGKLALAALDDARKHYYFNEKKVLLTGWSMGGYGVWNLAMFDPTRWSALMPLSGGGDEGHVASLKDIPVWAFHGANDALVKPDEGKQMVDALVAAGGSATFTELPDGTHNICSRVYGNEAVVAWMLNPQKNQRQLGTVQVQPVAAVNIPFVPAMEISQAVGIRLGNEVLDALSYSIPQTISRDLLTGGLNDMFDSTVASGRQFSIRFSGISYSGQLERVVAKGWGKDRILVQLGIRNVTLTISGTSVNGARHSAQAGPITIAIGQRYPVWLNLELSPYIADRKLRLRLVGTGFQIPSDNWSVSQPAGVSVQGFGMTEEAVVTGLRNGLYGAKGRIENEVIGIAPRIVQEIEKNLILPESASTASESSSTLAKIWPLPINAPRFQAWPEQITADQNGISLVLGLTIASLEPFSPPKPLKYLRHLPSDIAADSVSGFNQARISLTQLPSDQAMHFVVAPRILGPVTQLYVDADQARLDLLDIPEPLFGELAQRSTLQEIIPDLKKYGENLQVRSTLRVVKPLEVGLPEMKTADAGLKPFEFKLSAVKVDVSIKSEPNQAQWQPCAVFDLSVSEQVRAELLKPAHDQRLISLDWLPASNVTGRGQFAEGYQPAESALNDDRYVELFKDAWAAYCAGMKSASAEVPDLTVGLSKLRMFDVKWDSPIVDVTYRLARIKLSNLTEQSFTYQTKAPTSAWGEALTLKPGGSHEFEIPYPLTYRKNLGTATEIYTLPLGSHSEFRIPVTGGAPRLFAAKRP